MFGHRSDGYLIKDIDPIVSITGYLMPMRCDAQVFTQYKVDFEKLSRYIVKKGQEGHKITFMELIIAAYVRAVSQQPQINRFIANKRLYARNQLSVSFTMVRSTDGDDFSENTTKCQFDPSDTIFDVSARVNAAIEQCKQEEADNSSLKIAKLLRNPLLATTIAAIARFLDRYGLCPRILLDASPFHASMFFTNVASIGLPYVQHHLANFGTLSQFFALGMPERTVALDTDGKPVRKRLLPIGVVIDERVCEGAMYSRMTSIMSRMLNDPELLEQPPEEVRYDEGHEYHVPKPEAK